MTRSRGRRVAVVILPDLNLLLYAYNSEDRRHDAAKVMVEGAPERFYRGRPGLGDGVGICASHDAFAR